MNIFFFKFFAQMLFPDWRILKPDQFREERFLRQVAVVVLQQVLAGMHEFHGYHLESFSFETCDDFTDQPSVNRIRFKHDETSLSIGWVLIQVLTTDNGNFFCNLLFGLLPWLFGFLLRKRIEQIRAEKLKNLTKHQKYLL